MTAKEQSTDVRTLILDIEVEPAEAWVWQLYDVTVGLNQLKKSSSIMSWSAKWAGEDEIYFSSVFDHGKEGMLLAIWVMLDEADEVVTFNGDKFDLRHINAEFMVEGLGPPSPYKKIDLLKVVRKNSKFMSNRLQFLSESFGIGSKVDTGGFELWVDCMNGNKKAWKLLREYNEEDVLLTERLYDRLRPWITTGVNRSSVLGDHACPACGSRNLQRRGYSRTTTQTYQRWQCECGTWSRSRVADKGHKTPLVLAR